MYSIVNFKKYKNKGKLIDKTELLDIDGFLLKSRKKVLKVDNCNIRELRVSSKKLANPIVSKKVSQKYDKLIANLTELLLDEDDESGASLREALNQIEKFRLEIKNKYRNYLKKKELEKMSKQLSILKKEATLRLMEIRERYIEYMNSNTRSR